MRTIKLKNNNSSKKNKMLGGNKSQSKSSRSKSSRSKSSRSKSSRSKTSESLDKLRKKSALSITKQSQRSSLLATRRSQRSLPPRTIPVLTLGNGSPAIPTYNNQMIEPADIESFVKNKINIGYQIVCLPIPPDESHSIIVERLISGVKIVDWGGEETRRITIPKWKNYKTLIDCLEKNYGKIEYYDKDESIHARACIRSNTNHGQGGCSQYVHNWIEKYIGEDGKYAILYKEENK